MDSLALISILSDGEFHSGSELGACFGVSRTAVWKALAHLEQYGLVVESVKGKGYRLNQSLSLINSDSVVSALPEAISSQLSFKSFPSVDSTNSVAAEIARESDKDFVCIYSEMQTAGRGRRGRSWYSPFAQNIYMSLAFSLDGGAESIAGLSLVAGLSVRRAIMRCASNEHVFESLKLKWPNDVLLGDSKLAGLLVELQGEVSDSWRVVVGLGLNFSMSGTKASEIIDQSWVALGDKLDCTKDEFLSVLIECLVEDMLSFKKDGFAIFQAEWCSHDYFADRLVGVVGSDMEGRSLGVDLSGNLMLDTKSGVEVINAGEVSVRPRSS